MGLHFCCRASLWCRVDAPSSPLFCYFISHLLAPLHFCPHARLILEFCFFCPVALRVARRGGRRSESKLPQVCERLCESPAACSSCDRVREFQEVRTSMQMSFLSVVERSKAGPPGPNTHINHPQQSSGVCAAATAVRISIQNQTSVIAASHSAIQMQLLFFLLRPNAPAA